MPSTALKVSYYWGYIYLDFLKQQLKKGKHFSAVKDIHSALEITVYDEDSTKKAEFLGRVAIPLLQVTNIAVF